MQVSISQSRCLSFQGRKGKVNVAKHVAFQSRNRDAYHFRVHNAICHDRLHRVSISQSRCLSFQGATGKGLLASALSFNLAIEMLIISGCAERYHRGARLDVSISQSRCLSFQDAYMAMCGQTKYKFQSRNRDAYHFRREARWLSEKPLLSVSISQSRCLSFQESMYGLVPSRFTDVSISQSRCLSFQVPGTKLSGGSYGKCFNLAIEMLVISGGRKHSVTLPNSLSVSISQSRCLSFQDRSVGGVDRLLRLRFNLAIEMLVISGHSFVPCEMLSAKGFQSRNRDACHFR